MLEFQEPCRRYFNISAIVTLSTISINLKRCQRFKPTKSRECCYEDILCLNNFQDCFPGGPSSVFKYSRCVELRVECVLWVNLAFVTQHMQSRVENCFFTCLNTSPYSATLVIKSNLCEQQSLLMFIHYFSTWRLNYNSQHSSPTQSRS